MMDSQETALTQGLANEEQQPTAAAEVTNPATDTAAAPTEEPASEPQPQAEEADKEEPARHIYTSKEEVLERARELAQGEEKIEKSEMDLLKSVFYRLLGAERDEKMKQYLAEGGDPESYQLLPDETEEAFKAQMSVIKEKRQQQFVKLEAEKQANLETKLDIIERIKALATSPEEAGKSYQDFKQLQHTWRETGLVPAERTTELWRNYQFAVEQFYDLLKLNIEARELDFKKNLEQKTALCEQAEKLNEVADVVSAFHQLQELHQQYREIGPVAKELREEIWARFKAASTVINKKHQQHFEELRAQEEDNLAKKTALCEQAEAITAEPNKTAADWERHTQQLVALQAEWKKVGFAPQKMNVRIFERFRNQLDTFFQAKNEHFKEVKKQYAANAQKKRSLVEQAQALADSTDWRATADKLIALQKEWKTIGMVPHKLGDQLWNDFLTACNKFFDARKAAGSGARNEEQANLEKKQHIIAQIRKLAEEAVDGAQEAVRKLQDDYQAVGHVPFKQKDKVYAEYRAALDEVYEKLHLNNARKRMDNFRGSLKQMAGRGAEAITGERGKLQRRLEALKQELSTYENNLGFLSASSKKGNSLVDEMNRRMQRLKDDLDLVKQKIKAIDQEEKN